MSECVHHLEAQDCSQCWNLPAHDIAAYADGSLGLRPMAVQKKLHEERVARLARFHRELLKIPGDPDDGPGESFHSAEEIRRAWERSRFELIEGG